MKRDGEQQMVRLSVCHVNSLMNLRTKLASTEHHDTVKILNLPDQGLNEIQTRNAQLMEEAPSHQ